MTLTLRPATSADVPALAALGRKAFIAKFAELYTKEDLHSFLETAHSEEKVAAELANPAMRIHLAERDGQLAAFCKLVTTCGWPEHARGMKAIELKQLYADPDQLGGGVGTVLMDWAMAEASGLGADEIQLSVYSENVDAQRFYGRFGFAKVADIEFWVGEQCDAEFLFAAMI